jgi:hypothetical protein
MTRRFSPEELFYLRNRVPVTHVLKTLLKAPLENRGKRACFICPLCRGFNTSINSPHNLLRCFDCRRNLNPIELVMQFRAMDFVAGVKWLKENDGTVKPWKSRTTSSQPVHIGQILAGLLTPPPVSSTTDIMVIKRLEQLEQKVERLFVLVQKLNQVAASR